MPCMLHDLHVVLHVARFACCTICMLYACCTAACECPRTSSLQRKGRFPNAWRAPPGTRAPSPSPAQHRRAALPSLEYLSKPFLPNDTGRTARSEACTCLALVCQPTAIHSVTLPLRERVRQHDGELHAPRRMPPCITSHVVSCGCLKCHTCSTWSLTITQASSLYLSGWSVIECWRSEAVGCRAGCVVEG
jgi:hypothetical protein